MIVVPSRFRVVRELGEGGMGVVYEAFDEERKGLVALKALRNVSPESIVRFKREFRALQDIQHPNLVSLGELIFEGGQWFLTMELVDGVDFLSYVRTPERRYAALARVAHTPTPASPRDYSLVVGGSTHVVAKREDRDTNPGDDGDGNGGRTFDEARLRSSLRQLALALAALHGAGLVHRDIKPSNVRVTSTGRVVVLDFGLVSGVGAKRESTDAKILGTPAYMAPEQAATNDAGPAVDWYAVGVVLYEALTGLLPFDGAPLQMLLAKQQSEPPPPSVLEPDAPPDLDALCARLLRYDPAARPTADEVLAALRARVEAPSASSAAVSGTQSAPFVGRASELSQLRAAFAESRAKAPVTIFLEGESGVGKTCLVQRFVEALADDEPEAVVLTGRCYERETVPYKALDGVVDALARALGRLAWSDAARVIPTRPGPLVQVFPVLRRVEAIAKLPLPSLDAMDPLEVRSRAFAGLRELFVRLADLYPLVIAIDDVQWADADSHALMAELLRPPGAPRLLLLATTRATAMPPTEATLSSIQLASVNDVATALPGDVRVMPIRKLAAGEARALAAQLLERTSGADDEKAAASIAAEADGHPLFIDALVRHAAASGGRARMRLDDALWASIERLDPRAREVMELLAVAGAPIPQNVLTTAAGAERAETFKLVSFLRVAHLVQTTGSREADRIEPYHDRLRVTILSRIDDDRRAHHHQRIALAYETTETNDAQMLATHWRGARDAERAARYAVLAGDEAARALAFDRAAKLYRRALRLRAWSSDERRALLTKLGTALANAGRGARAAAAFQEAARGAKEAEALDLRRRAADQLLRSGHFDEGVAAIGQVLEAVGMKLPPTLWLAIVAFVVGRITLAVRGLGFARRDSSQIAPRDLTLVDICSSAAVGLILADNIRSAAFQSRNLLLALRAGETYRIARALAFEVAYLARGGGKTWRRTTAAIAKAQSLAKESGNPHALALSVATAGVAHYLSGRFRESLAMCDAAQAKFRDECADAAWEIDSMQVFALSCLAFLGDLAELTRRQPIYLREALDRGDLHAAVNLRIGHANLVSLVADDAGESRTSAAAAMADWSKEGFHIEHWYALLSATQTDLYEGEAGAAHARVTAEWPTLRRSLLRTIQSVRIQSTHLRARATLAAAEAKPAERASLVRLALADARALERERMPWATALAKLVRAGALGVGGGAREAAADALRDAASRFDAAEMFLYGAAAKHALGRVAGGDEGARLVADAEAWLRERGVKAPERLVAMLAPGFGGAREAVR